MKTRMAGLIAVTLMMALSVAHAEEPGPWRAEIAPYAWSAGIDGTITVDGQEIEFEKSASDLFDYVEFSGGLTGSVQYNHWVFRGQFDYFSLSTDALEVENQPRGGKLDSEFVLTELGAGYQIGGWKEGQTFELLVGLRLLHVKNDLEKYGVGSYSKSSDLMDPMITARGAVPIFPSKIRGLWLNTLAAIGGGGDSDLVYELQPQLLYQFTYNADVRLGYRRIGWNVDSDENDDELDFGLAGLVFGVGFNF